jgi:hypothetical protein
MPPPTQDISSRVSFASLTPNNVGTVRKLNSVLFPVKYSDKFYHEIVQPDVEDFCRLGAPSWTHRDPALSTVRSVL